MYCGGTAYFGVDNKHEENWCFFYNRLHSEHRNNAEDMIQVKNNAKIAYQGFKHFSATDDKDDQNVVLIKKIWNCFEQLDVGALKWVWC